MPHVSVCRSRVTAGDWPVALTPGEVVEILSRLQGQHWRIASLPPATPSGTASPRITYVGYMVWPHGRIVRPML